MSIVPLEGYADFLEAPELNPPAPRAPSAAIHLGVLLIMAVFGIPGVYLMTRGEILSGTLLVAIPYVVICLIEPFLGLCILFAISPVDSIYSFGNEWTSGTKILAIPLGLGFILHLITRPSMRFRLPKETGIFFGLAVWAIIGVMWSPAPMLSALGVSQLTLLTTMLLMVVGMVRSPEHFKQLVFYVFLGTFALGLYTVINPAHLTSAERTTFSEVNPNNFGRSLAFGCLGGLYLAWESRSALKKLLLCAGCIVLLIGVAATHGRGTYVALAGALVCGILVAYRANVFRALLVLIGLAMLIALVAFLAYQLGFFAQRQAIERLQTWDITTGGRWLIWEAGFRAGAEHPLRGWGFMMFKNASGTGRDPHSVMLKLFVELGLPGLALWGAVILMLAVSAIRAPTRSARFFMTALLGMVFLGGLTFNNFHSKTVWYEMGVILALRQLFAHGMMLPSDGYDPGVDLGPPDAGIGEFSSA